jgi:arylsulfatase A-like enzyme
MTSSAPASPSQTQSVVSTAIVSAISLLSLAIWFGIFAGLTEGLGLLTFQRINWRQWGRIIHVSKEIVWISPVVDVLFFVMVAVVVALVSCLWSRLPVVRVLVLMLTFLTVYGWLTLTNRLYHRACWLLALGVAVAFTRWLAKHELVALRFWRKTAPWMVAAFLLVFIAIQGGKWIHEEYAVARLPQAAAGSPNVLVIVLDTLRADHLSSYNYSRPTSPQIDRIAGQGVLFENAVATCSWSLPSHASLVTGQYPAQHDLQNVQPMPWLGWGNDTMAGYLTLGEALQRRGYRTGAFSANRNFFTSNVGLGRGFLHFEDYFDSMADSFIRTLYGKEFARLYLNRTEHSSVIRALRYLGMDSMLDKDDEGSGNYGGAFAVRKRASAVNQEVLRWIERDRQRPFFAFLNYMDVHYSYGGPRGYPKPEWDRATTVDEYDAGLRYVDDYLGRLLADLRRDGLAENTIVVITSDHGESLGGHGMNYHGISLYWDLIHVPLIIFYPGHVPAGLRVTTPVTNAAIPSTIMELVSMNSPRNPDSAKFPEPLAALWTKPEVGPKWPSPLSELARNEFVNTDDKAVVGKIPTAADGNMVSLVTPRWHLIVHQKLGAQLYDWTVDPRELNNLIDTREGQATAVGLSLELDSRISRRDGN